MDSLHRVRAARPLTALAVLIWAAAALAGEAAVPTAAAEALARGKALAEAHCAVCHAIGLDDDSPARANDDAPFRRLHERYPIPMLTEAAQTGSLSGHDEMPGFDFPIEDMQALLAYIDSLAPGKPRYAGGPRPK